VIARRFREVVLFFRERRLFLITRLRETFFLEDFLADFLETRFAEDFLLAVLFFCVLILDALCRRIITFGPLTFRGRAAARLFAFPERFLPTRFGLLAVRATCRFDLLADLRATRRFDLVADLRATLRFLVAAFLATRRLGLVAALRADFLATLLMAIVGLFVRSFNNKYVTS